MRRISCAELVVQCGGTASAARKENGFTFQQVCDCNASSDTLEHDIWRIQDGLLPVFAEPEARYGAGRVTDFRASRGAAVAAPTA